MPECGIIDTFKSVSKVPTRACSRGIVEAELRLRALFGEETLPDAMTYLRWRWSTLV